VKPAERHTDVLIVGGGLVGSALACALADLPLDTVLVEAHEIRPFVQPGFDQRVTALANGSQRILAGLSLWRSLHAQAEAIRSIHICEQGRFGAARIHAEEEGVAALGYTIENQVLGRVLWENLQGRPRFSALAPAQVRSLRASEDGVTAQIQARGEQLIVHAKLLVAADGERSWVRRELGIAVREDDYAQRAVILNCTTEAAPDGRAFERFTPTGPIAFLPLTADRAAVVWTLPAAAAAQVTALAPERFRDELQSAFGHRLGRITRIGERHVHSLARVVSEPLASPRVVLIGNAALSLHPVAGQGFNLALRDVATLAEVIADGLRDSAREADPGRAELLAHYRQWRADDQRRVSRFTHGLIRLFGDPAPGLGLGRGLGLMAFDLLPGAKALLARQTMGRAGRLPRLARGLRLA
jgi:2-octaprenyl-6-methoxyphenol hydroxylase